MKYVLIVHDYHNDYIRTTDNQEKADEIYEEIKYKKQMSGSNDSRVFIHSIEVE